MAYYEYPCEQCGETMTATRRDKRFCSRICKYRSEPNRKRGIIRSRQWHEANPMGHKNWAHNCDDWNVLFAELLETQEGKCYLCEDLLHLEKYREVHLDHDHSCCPNGRSCKNCRRGLACNACNIAIGYAREDPDRLRRMADNLEKVLKIRDRTP
jgi:hypothetical protein